MYGREETQARRSTKGRLYKREVGEMIDVEGFGTHAVGISNSII